MKNCDCKEYGPTVLRVFLGLLFLIPGIDKLIGMASGGHMIAQMIGPALAWIVLLVEIIFGIALLLGWKFKISVWPLVAIMLVATVMVVIPSFGTNPMAMINLLFHLLALAGLVSLYLTGPGAHAIKGQA